MIVENIPKTIMAVLQRLSTLAVCVVTAAAADDAFVVQFDVSVPSGDESFRVKVTPVINLPGPPLLKDGY